ncbi:MAG TPA: dUTP diphosphatase [Spirochaetota bacterium]|nr:dUTP diphosphatase [Spirochaetota bacterium]HPY03358.1 dUTP diphosphatase [Spirochaetota bacterium]HQA53116.1 dUTP diphosphatase [Spirochaetota bacterium]
MIPVKIVLAKGASFPDYQTEGSAGADLCAFTERDILLKKGETALIPTGVSMEIPVGYEAQVRPRSGLAVKHGITLLNSPGTIDSDYRGEIKVIMTNLGAEDFRITNGMRIAQVVFAKVYRAHFLDCELSETKRGSGGFGHTGA